MAMPRLEIQCIDDLKILFEVGIMQPDHAVRISEVLLGATAKKPKLQQDDDKKKEGNNAASI